MPLRQCDCRVPDRLGVVYRTAAFFQLSVPAFLLDTRLTALLRHTGCDAFPGHYQCFSNERLKSFDRGSLIASLTAVFLRLDDNAIRCDSTIGKRRQAIANLLRQRFTVSKIEPQVHGSCKLVDVLSASTLRANCLNVDVASRDNDVVVDSDVGYHESDTFDSPPGIRGKRPGADHGNSG